MNKSTSTIARYNALTIVTFRIVLGLFVCCLFVCCLFVAAALLPGRVYANEMPNIVLLPMIQSDQNSFINPGQAPAVRGSTDTAICEFNTQEQELADLMRNAAGQQRAALNCNPALSMVAQAMAQDMADRDYFDAVSPEGIGPNYLALQAGYALPSYYNQARNANNIAFIAAGHATAQEMWGASVDKPQLLATNEFYAQQTDVGIGYVMASKASTYRHYWVVITAPPADAQ